MKKIINQLKSTWSNLFGKHLLLTNTITCGALFAAGDAIQQKNELWRNDHAKGSFDWHRTGRFFIIGLSQGPPHHYFYIWLDKKFPLKTPKSVVKKVVLDELLGAPFFAITFFMLAGLLEGNTLQGAFDEFKRKFLAIYLFDWVYWPPVQAVNFAYVPLKYRVLAINGATVIWDIFLSYMKHYDLPKIDAQLKEELNKES